MNKEHINSLQDDFIDDNFLPDEFQILTGGERQGMTLPSVIFHDLDYFLYSFESGRLKQYQPNIFPEAEELYKRTQVIRIPPRKGVFYYADYYIHNRGKRLYDLKLL